LLRDVHDGLKTLVQRTNKTDYTFDRHENTRRVSSRRFIVANLSEMTPAKPVYLYALSTYHEFNLYVGLCMVFLAFFFVDVKRTKSLSVFLSYAHCRCGSGTHSRRQTAAYADDCVTRHDARRSLPFFIQFRRVAAPSLASSSCSSSVCRSLANLDTALLTCSHSTATATGLQ